jgi:polysaccharide pyruvyl transferase WcaK-like protein
MNILVDSCSYNCQNAGDLAMLTVAVSRLRELWPSATINVITNAPERIRRHCGDVGIIPVRGRRLLLRERLLGSLSRRLPDAVAEPWSALEGDLRVKRPAIFGASLRVKGALGRLETADAASFLAAINAADLVVVNGAGILTDAFMESALGILATLDLAIHRGVPTAMFGQGLGPISDAELRRRAAEVLPHVTLIGIRESRTGLPLLQSFRVNPAKVFVTGDDAVEMAFSARLQREAPNARDGMHIGVNVRVASYADVGREMLTALRDTFERVRRARGAQLVPIPIAHHGGGMDVDTLRELLGGEDDGGAALDTPRLVIDRIGKCRVMVTGSYHGAVFALAQGIPAVALANSTYYLDKMAGLADQFGVGCEVVRLDEADVSVRLESAIDRALAQADAVQGPLLRAAVDQIERGRSAYARLRQLVPPPPA